MSEAEFIESINLHATSAMSAFGIYISLTFAFLTSVYLIGAKLSRTQMVMVSSLYLAWSIAFSLVAIVHLIAFDSLFEEYTEFARSKLWFFPWTEFATFVLVGGIVISGYFVFDVRRGRISADTESD